MSTEIFFNKWLSLWEDNGYVFSRETRCNGHIVAVLIFDTRRPGLYYGRMEITPAHSNNIELTSITGGVEPEKSPEETAVMEIEEEAGFFATTQELIPLGTVRPSKSADTVVHLFAWNARGQTPIKPQGDGSEGEKLSYCRWVSDAEMIWCKCPLVSAMLARMAQLDFV